MQDAALSQLHSSLSAQEAVRGAHGGLGFDKATDGKTSKKKKKETHAEQSLMKSSTSSGRTYEKTTAAAVAAGHWDPFARPIEFKMNEVNRKVGTLYSMFVKGGVEGNTLKEAAPDAAPAQAPAAASSSAAADDDSSSSFNWKRAISEALRAEPGREMKLKSLRHKVLAAHGKAPAAQRADAEEARRLFKKRLKKMDTVTIDGKLVRLKKVKVRAPHRTVARDCPACARPCLRPHLAAQCGSHIRCSLSQHDWLKVFVQCATAPRAALHRLRACDAAFAICERTATRCTYQSLTHEAPFARLCVQ